MKGLIKVDTFCHCNKLSFLDLRAQDSGSFLVSMSAHLLQNPDNHQECLWLDLAAEALHASLDSGQDCPSKYVRIQKQGRGLMLEPPWLFSIQPPSSTKENTGTYPMQTTVQCPVLPALVALIPYPGELRNSTSEAI